MRGSSGWASGRFASAFPSRREWASFGLRACRVGFGIDPQTVGDPVDVVEVRDDLRRVVDGAIVPARGAQSLDVLRLHRARGSRELVGIHEQREGLVVETCGTEIVDKSVDERIVLDLIPEVAHVRGRSVAAIVGLRNDDGEHLTLGSRNGGAAAHRFDIELDAAP